MNEEQADKMIELLEKISTSLCKLNDTIEWERREGGGVPARKILNNMADDLSDIKYHASKKY